MKPWWQCKGGLSELRQYELSPWIKMKRYMTAPKELQIAAQAEARKAGIPLGETAGDLRKAGWYVPPHIEGYRVLGIDGQSPTGLSWQITSDHMFALAC